ncbi:MAG TPA: lasso peptide biosynthesis B2 protein [Longimicrobiaceae bacterium]
MTETTIPISRPRGGLPRIERSLLLARVFLVAMAAPALVRLPLSALERFLEPRRPPPPADAPTVARVSACVERVLRGGGPWIRPGCLTRGVTRYYFLRRAGMELRLCFGATLTAGGRLSGHCWLERDGRPYLEEGDPRTAFVVMHRIPSALPRPA